MSTAERWYLDYFDDAFLRIYQGLLPVEDGIAEAEAVMEILDLSPGDRVLDLGCGWGRHAVPMAEAGLRVVGVDRSQTLLREAIGASRSVAWVRADVRELPLRPGFRAVVSLFSSLGYFPDDEDDLRALRGARDLLQPDGLFLLETMHRDLIAREYAERDWWEDQHGTVMRVEREFDAVAGISHERLFWRDRNGAEGEKRHSIRVRSASEWAVLLERAALWPVAWYGSWDAAPFSPSSPRLIVVARPI